MAIDYGCYSPVKVQFAVTNQDSKTVQACDKE